MIGSMIGTVANIVIRSSVDQRYGNGRLQEPAVATTIRKYFGKHLATVVFLKEK